MNAIPKINATESLFKGKLYLSDILASIRIKDKILNPSVL